MTQFFDQVQCDNMAFLQKELWSVMVSQENPLICGKERAVEENNVD